MANKKFVITYDQYNNVNKFIKNSTIYVCIFGIVGCSTTVVNQANEINVVPIEKQYQYLVVSQKFPPAKNYVSLQKQFKPIARDKKYSQISKLTNYNKRFRATSVKYQMPFRYQPAFNVYEFQRYYQWKGIISLSSNTNYGKYGMTRRSKYGTPRKHNGVDIVGNIGDYVYAVASGIAEISPTGTGGKLGVYVRIKENNSYYTDHAHLSRVAVMNGTWVNTGDLIGYIGKTGNVPAHLTAHVHISRWEKLNGKQSFTDPTQLVLGYIFNNSYATR